jgi:hypothetical protein
MLNYWLDFAKEYHHFICCLFNKNVSEFRENERHPMIHQHLNYTTMLYFDFFLIDFK